MRARALIASAVAGTALVGIVAVPSVAQTSGVHRWLGSVGLVATPASFTELAITNADKLYATVDWYGRVTFSFVATNVGSQTKSYTWSVGSGPQGKQHMMSHGAFSLAGHQSRSVPVAFTIADCTQRNLITVSLTGPDAREPALHYWVLNRKSAAWKASGGPGCVG